MLARRASRAVASASKVLSSRACEIRPLSTIRPADQGAPRRARKVTVLGSGSFGTAMATVLARNGFNVSVLTRRDAVSKGINTHHRNVTYLNQYPLPFNVRAEVDAEKALADTDLIVHSIPVQATLPYLREIKDLIPTNVPIVNTSKGLHTTTLQLMDGIIPEALERDDQPLAYFSGPTFAKELMEGWPTGAVIAAEDQDLARVVAAAFASPCLRVWTSDDVVGIEVAGALKNVYAIASGMVEGLGLGLNTTSLIVTRAVAELNQLASALGARPDTLVGLGGIGDLMLTSYGGLSRNRSVGVRLGRGETMQEILASSTEVAEGVATTPAAHALAKRHHVNAPIISSVHHVLEGDITPVDALVSLMDQDATAQPENILGSSAVAEASK